MMSKSVRTLLIWAALVGAFFGIHSMLEPPGNDGSGAVGSVVSAVAPLLLVLAALFGAFYYILRRRGTVGAQSIFALRNTTARLVAETPGVTLADVAGYEDVKHALPLAHLDPVGTLLPLLRVPFGWAKPVPVNPNRFRSDVSLGAGLVITAAAGPLANFVLTGGSLTVIAIVSRFAPGALRGGSSLYLLLRQGVVVNLALGFFNLLPIPPLDGSRIVDGLIPFEWRGVWAALSKYGGLILVLVVFVAPLFGLGLLDWVPVLGQKLLFAAWRAG